MFLGLLSICVLSVLVFNSIAYSYAQEINSESTTGTSKNDGTVYIDINERGDFVPKEVKVKIGQTVTWTNKGLLFTQLHLEMSDVARQNLVMLVNILIQII